MPVSHVYQSAAADSSGTATIRFYLPAGLPRAILQRLVAGVPFPSGQVLTDSFGTAVASGWGTPDIGPAFVVSGTNIFSVSGGTGRATNTAQGAVVSPVAVADGNLYAELTAIGSSVIATDVGRLLLRATDQNAAYYLRWDTSGGTTLTGLAIGKIVGGTPTVLAGPVAVGPFTAPVNLRFTAIGTLLSGVVWASGTTEPAAPDVQATDATITAAGGMGVMRVGTGNQTLQTDNLIGVAETQDPTWDMYENLIDPTTLLESSAGTRQPRWVPTLVNGRLVEQGFNYFVVARGMAPGSIAALTADLVYGAPLASAFG